MRAVPDLVERRVGFEYGYNMTCPDCPGITTLTSAEYYRECNDAHVKCAHCKGDIHFGPAVMALRDADDPVLDDHTACTVAWYHTSTKPGWPGNANPMPPSAVKLLAGMMPPDAVRRARHRHETQALHLGTYETAVESMLRRMHDQDDGGEQFYLHRVALRDGLIIEQGWRDENSAEAAQITQPDLGDVDAIAVTAAGPAAARPRSTPPGTRSATRWNAALPSSGNSAPSPPATTSASGSTRAPSTSPRSASGSAIPSHDPRDTPQRGFTPARRAMSAC